MPPRRLVAAYVEPDSTAALAPVNLVRGAEVQAIDGVDLINANDPASVDRLNAGLFPAAAGEMHNFTISEPGQVLLLDDARVIHETTPIQPTEANRVGHRDTLVITLRAGAFQGP